MPSGRVNYNQRKSNRMVAQGEGITWDWGRGGQEKASCRGLKCELKPGRGSESAKVAVSETTSMWGSSCGTGPEVTLRTEWQLEWPEPSEREAGGRMGLQ